MTSNGFLTERTNSPAKFGMVLLLHAAAIGGVLLIKGPEIIRIMPPDTDVYNVPIVPLPDEIPIPPEPQHRVEQVQPMPTPPIDRSTPLTDTLPTLPYQPPQPPIQFADNGAGTGTGTGTVIAPPQPPVHVPVRVDATMLSTALQPPYPASEIRAQREGRVQVRVTINTAGRVIAVERLSATSDAFFEATQRQALNRWRFRPATEDGRPTNTTKVLTIHFRLDGVE